MIERLDHVGIVVRDLEKATQHYATLLGRTPTWVGQHPAHGSGNAIFRLHNTYIELLSPIGEGGFGDLLRAHLAEKGEGLFLLAYGSDDLAATYAALSARGLTLSEPTRQLAQDSGSGGWRHFHVSFVAPTDSAGIRSLIVQHEEDLDALMPVSAPMAAEPACAEALDHVVVMTGDPERALRYYGEQLGLRLALDRSFEKRGVRLMFFRTGGTTVEVGASTRKGGQLETDASDDTLWGAAYRVADIDAAYARVRDAGIETTEFRDGNKAGTRVFTVKSDTHGVPTLIIGPA